MLIDDYLDQMCDENKLNDMEATTNGGCGIRVVDLALIDWVAVRVFLSVPNGKQTIEKRLNG